MTPSAPPATSPIPAIRIAGRTGAATTSAVEKNGSTDAIAVAAAPASARCTGSQIPRRMPGGRATDAAASAR